jgi:L-aspartate oxidase
LAYNALFYNTGKEYTAYMIASPPTVLHREVSVLIVGTGISGLYTALKLASAQVNCLLITKSTLEDSNSRYAQGGIATVIPSNTADSVELHVRDTLLAGAGLCDEVATRSILSDGYAAIEDLLRYGVDFDRDDHNQLALTREAAHSVDRIIHAGGDATGHSVEMALIAKVKQSPFIEVMSHTLVTELRVQDNWCYGCIATQNTDDTCQTLVVDSTHVVLATGGIGRLYSHSTNPAIATGNGIFLAQQAGASIQNMEFIQFHPTAFYHQGELRFLVSEALRGEGGILRDAKGIPFAKKYHEHGEMAPRDIVTRAIFSEMNQSGLPHVYLDISHLPDNSVEKRFPNILANCLAYGCDIRTDWIPVAPAAHYLMGGITVDTQGQTTVNNLYTVGESSYTGLHGANRLASNSLLECVVLARRVSTMLAEKMADPFKTASPSPYCPDSSETLYHKTRKEDCADIEHCLETLRRVMWRDVGVLRDQPGLLQAQKEIQALLLLANQKNWRYASPEGFELYSQLVVSGLIVVACLQRTGSLGAHTRTDSLLTGLPQS